MPSICSCNGSLKWASALGWKAKPLVESNPRGPRGSSWHRREIGLDRSRTSPSRVASASRKVILTLTKTQITSNNTTFPNPNNNNNNNNNNKITRMCTSNQKNRGFSHPVHSELLVPVLVRVTEKTNWQPPKSFPTCTSTWFHVSCPPSRWSLCWKIPLKHAWCW